MKKITEKQFTVESDGSVTVSRPDAAQMLLYDGGLPGRLALAVMTSPAVSKLAGAWMSSPCSVSMIDGFIRKNGIDMSEYESVPYASFNDFFTRHLLPGRRPVDGDPDALVSPADARVSAYKLSAGAAFFIKGVPYTVRSLLRDGALAEKFAGGICLVFRLAVDDYHRYCFFDGGRIIAARAIEGVLHTVNPVSLGKYCVYAENSREYTVMETNSFGLAVQAEIGAMLVGKICNHKDSGSFERGEEKGYFEFGGSTVMLLLRRGRARIRADIVKNTLAGAETRVKLGERIGARGVLMSGTGK